MPPDWMTGFVIGSLIASYVMLPILVLVHELGHAVAVIRAGRRPVVFVGKSPAMVVCRFKSFDLCFHPRLPLEHFYPNTKPNEIPKNPVGACSYDAAGLTVAQVRAIISAGPHTSIIAGLCFGVLAHFASPGSVLFWMAAVTAVCEVLDGLGNLVPTQMEGRLFSDGARMMRLRGLPDDMVVPARRQVPAGEQRVQVHAD